MNSFEWLNAENRKPDTVLSHIEHQVLQRKIMIEGIKGKVTAVKQDCFYLEYLDKTIEVIPSLSQKPLLNEFYEIRGDYDGGVLYACTMKKISPEELMESQKRDELKNESETLKNAVVQTLQHGKKHTLDSEHRMLTFSECEKKKNLVLDYYPKQIQSFFRNQQAFDRKKDDVEKRKKQIYYLMNIDYSIRNIKMNLAEAESELNQCIYGQDKAKKQVLHVLNEMKLHPEQSHFILFCGAEGTGRHTLASFIQKQLNYPAFSFDCYGLENLTLAGIVPCYEKADAGIIVTGLAQSGKIQTIVMMNGLDNLTKNRHDGDVSLILKRVFQHPSLISDRYFEGLEIPLDGVVWIGFCNDLASVPSWMKEKMEIIELHDYSVEMKIEAANSILLSQHFPNLSFEEGTIETLIHKCCFDDGMKDLIKHISEIAAQSHAKTITAQHVASYCNSVFVDPLEKKFRDSQQSTNPTLVSMIKELFREKRTFKDKDRRVEEWFWLQERLNTMVYCLCDSEEIKVDVEKMKACMDQTHIGCRNVKDTLLAMLMKKTRSKDSVKPKLLFGPPGTGKTSLIQSFANACDLPIVCIDASALTDLSILCGTTHRIGLLAKKISSVQTSRCILMIDEIDKAPKEIQGQLLNLLDDRMKCYDYGLHAEMDYSQTIVIASANRLDLCLDALLDRFDVCSMDSYCLEEKIEIVKRDYLHKLNQIHMNSFLSEESLRQLAWIHRYDEGLRGLKNSLNHCFDQHLLVPDQSTDEFVSNLVKKEKTTVASCIRPSVGQVIGLGVYGSQGVCFPVQCIKNDSHMVTGCPNQDQTLIQSVLTAEKAVNSLCKTNTHFHLHLTHHAIAKSGPSCGLAISAAMLSCLKNQKIENTAFTGEVDLCGNVHAVGNVNLKIQACIDAGITTVVLSEENRRDVVHDGIQLVYVKHLEEFVSLFFNENL